MDTLIHLLRSKIEIMRPKSTHTKHVYNFKMHCMQTHLPHKRRQIDTFGQNADANGIEKSNGFLNCAKTKRNIFCWDLKTYLNGKNSNFSAGSRSSFVHAIFILTTLLVELCH